METECLKIFDDQRNPIGVATREDVHRLGHWHETFHCWFVSREAGIEYIYLQNRSAAKKDYPNLLDITAAGHLLAHETVLDGIREVKEEIGIELAFADLVLLGIIEYCLIKGEMMDKELAHVFLYESKFGFEDFNLQLEEVSGMVRVEFASFVKLWSGERTNIKVEGFTINEAGERISIHKTVSKDRFVPHDTSYYERVGQWISMYLKSLKDDKV